MINGSLPEVNKSVWDIHLGYGKIVSVEGDLSFTVRFSAKEVVRYSTGGYQGKIRRIFWDNPVIVEPMADDKSWSTFRKVVKEMYELFRTLQK